MLNLLFTLPKDAKEAAKIEKQKIIELQRRERIFNPRNRLIGVDKDALEKQIAEKKARDEEEKAREEAFQLKLLRDDEIAKQLENEIKYKRRQLDEDVNNFRAVHQRKEDRREFDLNDPNYLKKSLPCRVLDDDPRLSISGAQITTRPKPCVLNSHSSNMQSSNIQFEGEDMDVKKRQRYQVEQQRTWLQQQVDERLRLENEKKLAEDAYTAALIARDQRARQLASLEAECRKQLEETTAKFNQALAAEQATQKRMKEMRELEDKRAEIYNCITGDFLTENPEVAVSCLGPSRIVGSSWKGMSPDEKDAITRDVLKQIEDNKKKREDQKKVEADWALMMNNFASSAAVYDSEMMRQQRELNRRLVEENKQIDMEQKRAKELEKQMLKSGGVTEDFYDQFNKTTR